MKKTLDNLVLKYETKNFIKNDPIQFPHQYKAKEDIEIAGFISALFSFGKREMFIKKLEYIFSLASCPSELIQDYKKHNLDEFVYRFVKSKALSELLKILNKLYFKDKSSLEELFMNKNRFENVTNYFYNNSKLTCDIGFNFLFAKPQNKSALKRLNMYLRWMVRNGDVDLGIWKEIKKNELIIPLDTHVARISRHFGLITRKQNDFNCAIELTNKLKEFDENDPVKYDFALFGYGIENPIL